MILDRSRPIDVSVILSVMSVYAELSYVDQPVGISAFEHPKAMDAIDDAAAGFRETVDDNVEHEDEIRRGLCWLLHQDDEVLQSIYRTGQQNLPLASPLMSDQRRLLDMLWVSGFADWRPKDYDATCYGLGDEAGPGGAPVLDDPLMPIDFRPVFALLREPVSGDADRAFGILVARASEEDDARLGLWWLLCQDDVVLDDVLDRGGVVLAGGIEVRRGVLQGLWDRLFADWRVEGFDPADYEVIGLPRQPVQTTPPPVEGKTSRARSWWRRNRPGP